MAIFPLLQYCNGARVREPFLLCARLHGNVLELQRQLCGHFGGSVDHRHLRQILIACSSASLALGIYYWEVNIAGNLLRPLRVPPFLHAGEVTIGPIGDKYVNML